MVKKNIEGKLSLILLTNLLCFFVNCFSVSYFNRKILFGKKKNKNNNLPEVAPPVTLSNLSLEVPLFLVFAKALPPPLLFEPPFESGASFKFEADEERERLS